MRIYTKNLRTEETSPLFAYAYLNSDGHVSAGAIEFEDVMNPLVSNSR